MDQELDMNVQSSSEQTDIQTLKAELQSCQEEREQLHNRYVRALADLENFKRRVQQERAQWSRSAQAQVLLKLLPVVDNFDRALQTHEQKGEDPVFDAWFEGFETIAHDLGKLLESFNVTPVANETEFDPEEHEAITQVESADHESGQIVQVYERGYRFGDVLLRPSKVTVAK